MLSPYSLCTRVKAVMCETAGSEVYLLDYRDNLFTADLALRADSILSILSSPDEYMRSASSKSALVESFHASQEMLFNQQAMMTQL